MGPLASAVFDYSFSGQTSLRQSLMTLFHDSHHLGSHDDSALLKRNLLRPLSGKKRKTHKSKAQTQTHKRTQTNTQHANITTQTRKDKKHENTKNTHTHKTRVQKHKQNHPNAHRPVDPPWALMGPHHHVNPVAGSSNFFFLR